MYLFKYNFLITLNFLSLKKTTLPFIIFKKLKVNIKLTSNYLHVPYFKKNLKCFFRFNRVKFKKTNFFKFFQQKKLKYRFFLKKPPYTLIFFLN